MYTKIKSKILNVNNKKLKTLGDSIRESFDGHKVKWNFITKKKNAQTIKEVNDKLTILKWKKKNLWKENTMSKVEMAITDWQKMLTMNLATEGLIAKIWKAVLENNRKKWVAWEKMDERWMDKFEKEKIKSQ